MLLSISKFVPVPMLTKYRLGDSNGAPMRCFWIHFKGRALFAHHWMR